MFGRDSARGKYDLLGDGFLGGVTFSNHVLINTAAAATATAITTAATTNNILQQQTTSYHVVKPKFVTFESDLHCSSVWELSCPTCHLLER